MRAETYAAAELLQLRHSAYSKDFDVKIIPVLGQLEDRNVLTTWTSLQMHVGVNMQRLCSSAAAAAPAQRCTAPAQQNSGPACLESTQAEFPNWGSGPQRCADMNLSVQLLRKHIYSHSTANRSCKKSKTPSVAPVPFWSASIGSVVTSSEPCQWHQQSTHSARSP